MMVVGVSQITAALHPSLFLTNVYKTTSPFLRYPIYLDIHQKQGDTVILGYSTFSCPLKFVAVAEKADLHT